MSKTFVLSIEKSWFIIYFIYNMSGFISESISIDNMKGFIVESISSRMQSKYVTVEYCLIFLPLYWIFNGLLF